MIEAEKVGGKEQGAEQGRVALARPGQAREAAADGEQGKQRKRRQQEAIEHGHLDGNGSELPGDGDPGAAPDKDGGKIEQEIHNTSGEVGMAWTTAWGGQGCAGLHHLAVISAGRSLWRAGAVRWPQGMMGEAARCNR
ncbi:hypothetical protein CDAIGKPJ_01927 [Aeromonas salmonicida]|nr:hypothetical protein ASA01S_032_00060 [Aeromonas salmonicida subsp. masoucida NBRC 13784]